MSVPLFYKPQTDLGFIVKNIAASKKTIRVFGINIRYNKTYNLLNIPDITEADIKASLAKGSLMMKINNK